MSPVPPVPKVPADTMFRVGSKFLAKVFARQSRAPLPSDSLFSDFSSTCAVFELSARNGLHCHVEPSFSTVRHDVARYSSVLVPLRHWLHSSRRPLFLIRHEILKIPCRHFYMNWVLLRNLILHIFSLSSSALLYPTITLQNFLQILPNIEFSVVIWLHNVDHAFSIILCVAYGYRRPLCHRQPL